MWRGMTLGGLGLAVVEGCATTPTGGGTTAGDPGSGGFDGGGFNGGGSSGGGSGGGSSGGGSSGGLPEPKVCIDNDDGKDFGCTKFYNDTLTADFEETFTVTISASDKLCFGAYDVDPLANDYADGSCWIDWIKLVKAGGYQGYLYNKLVYIDFSIKPTF